MTTTVPRLTLIPLPGHPAYAAGPLVVDVARGERVLDAASEAGFLVATRCGGVADCKTCRVEVPEGAHREHGLTVVEEHEASALAAVTTSTRARLACQARVLGDVAVLVPDPAAMEDE